MRHAIIVLGLICGVAGCATSRSQEAIIQTAKDRVFPAVVFIKPIQEEFRGGKRERVQVFGSGAIISPEGYVVTNNHVAEKAAEIRCVLYDKEEISATIVGLDPETDLAVIKLKLDERKNKSPLPCASFGDSSKMTEGDLVMAMGAPHGFERSISKGIISSTERYFEFAPYNTWFQTDAAINPGNSGGPLVNIRGEIIGINARSFRGAELMGFAIPSNIAKEVVDDLIAHGKCSRAWTGIRFQALRDFTKSSYLNATHGVLVASVDEGSPAEKAGLRAGDIVVTVAGVDVTGLYEIHLPEVERLFARLPVDQPASLSITRGSDSLTVSITPILKGRQEGEDFECPKWDLTVKEITKFSDPMLAFQRRKGVYIQGVKTNGNAYLSGLMPFDIVVSVEGREISGLKDLKEAYEKSLALPKGKRRALFKILRSGYSRLQVLDFEKDSEKIEDD